MILPKTTTKRGIISPKTTTKGGIILPKTTKVYINKNPTINCGLLNCKG